MSTEGKRKLWSWLWKEDKKSEETADSEKDKPPHLSKSESTSSTSSNAAEQIPRDGNTPTKTPPLSRSSSTSSGQWENHISKAKEVLQEIESIIQQELALMADDSFFVSKEGDGSMKPKKFLNGVSKRQLQRPAPKLIRPLHKKKNRMVQGEMEFDPESNTWIGNEEDLAVFHHATPALITHKSKKVPQVYGDMRFDPVEQVWRGNEKVLKRFNSKRGPSLITDYTPDPSTASGDMVFDSERMIWVGNDTVLDVFANIAPSEETNQFPVGTEFTLSAEMIAAFKKREEEHNVSLKGWSMDPSPSNPQQAEKERNYLHSIRNMSIIRIVHQAKQSGYSQETSDGSSTPTAAFGSSYHSGDSNLASSKSLSDDESSVTDTPKSVSLSSSQTFSEYVESVDDDYEDIEVNAQQLQKQLEKRLSSERTLGSRRNSLKDSSISFALSSDDEREELIDLEQLTDDLDGLDIPNGTPLQLKLPKPDDDDEDDDNNNNSDDEEEEDDEDLQWSDSESESKGTQPEEPKLAAPEKRVTEEDWDDVEIPTHGKFVLVRNHNTAPVVPPKKKLVEEDEEEYSGLDIPNEKNLPLANLFKNRLSLLSKDASEDEAFSEDDWSDVDVNTLKQKLKRHQL